MTLLTGTADAPVPGAGEAPVHRLARRANYDKRPSIPVGEASACTVGWEAIASRIRGTGATCIVLETYPGVLASDTEALLAALRPDVVVRTEPTFLDPATVDALVDPDVTDDPVFGRLSDLQLADFLDAGRLAAARAEVDAVPAGVTVVIVGVGASLVRGESLGDEDLLVYADLPRWELVLRQRAGTIANLGSDDLTLAGSLKYKRAYFVDWRVADRHKRGLFARMDLVLDTVHTDQPKAISGDDLRGGLAATATRPFRVVPFFDPGPWGGQWMKEVCDLPRDEVNFAWCFDCVPEENSLLFAFGEHRFELPSIDLVFTHPEQLLGRRVRERFGDEFPIRFDFLDTVGGGNLSLQVHPLTQYIDEEFGLHYTQDESYYLLDVEDDATVYLGVKEGVDRDEMLAALQRAQEDASQPFDADRYINRWDAKRHDHFLIPAGTVHCSGAGAMVLEISATPYIFTFKLWDWGRLGLDGEPRPINIERGAANIQWHRDTAWVRDQLVNVTEERHEGKGWRSERTGLHEAEFIDTHRHWFTDRVPHDTGGVVNVLNLVQGEQAIVESASDAFEPFVVHYAETFIVPAAVGGYTIRPHGPAEGTECATIKAFVR